MTSLPLTNKPRSRTLNYYRDNHSHQKKMPIKNQTLTRYEVHPPYIFCAKDSVVHANIVHQWIKESGSGSGSGLELVLQYEVQEKIVKKIPAAAPPITTRSTYQNIQWSDSSKVSFLHVDHT